MGNLTNVSKNGLLLIEKDNHIYTHSFEKKGYYNEKKDKVILVQGLKDIIKR